MDPSDFPVLDLSTLENGFPCVTGAFGRGCAEAAAVCFEDQGHSDTADLDIKGKYRKVFRVTWPRVTEQISRCWNDLEVTTEHGAYGIAFLLIKELTGYTVIERSRKGTGFDYWLGYDSEYPFQNKARLEVSGIRNGPGREVTARVRAKLGRTNRSNTSLPFFVIIVEFSQPIAQVEKNEPGE